MAFYLLLRGPLGAGKTTVADVLAREIGGRAISIDALLERLEWDGGSLDLFLRANELAEREIRTSLAAGAPAVVDGNFYWSAAISDLEERLPFPHAIFSLRVPVEECVRRDRGRPTSYGEEATREVFEKVARVDAGRPIDGRPPVDEVVREIVTHLRRDGFLPSA